MQALIYNGPGKKNLEDRPKPIVPAPTDAVVRVTKTTFQPACPARCWATNVSA